MTAVDTRPLSESELGGILAQVADHDADTDLLVVRGGSWDGPPVLDSQVGSVRVRFVPSVLAAHTALLDHDGGWLTLVTPVDMADLGQEIAARAWRHRVHRPSPWNAVAALFRVKALDPSLRGRDWMVEHLVAHAPSTGYPQPVSQVLDVETAWGHVLRGLGLPAQPTGRELLAWAITPTAFAAVDGLSPEARTEIGRHLDREVSPAGSVLVGLAGWGKGPGAAELGLVAEALWPDPAPVPHALFLERHFKPRDVSLTDDAAVELGRLAVDVVTRPGDLDLDVPEKMADAEALLTDLDQHDTADSSVLAASFDRRLLTAMQVVRDLAELDPDAVTPDELAGVLDHARDHRLASEAGGRRRVETVESAARLARRGQDVSSLDGSLADLVEAYRDDGAWVDAAWHRLLDGDPADGVAALLHDLVESWSDWRRGRDLMFADAVVSAAANDPAAASLDQESPLRIEQVLDTVVVPVARKGPVLLLVIDGLSHAAAPPLLYDVAQLGWSSVRPEARPLPGVVAAFPSITRVSRASLLSGRIVTGGQPVERDGFTSHVGLLEAADGVTPVLLHKADLRTAEGMSTPAREQIADRAQPVVGVVFNGVDDFLGTDGQLRLLDGLEGLPGLDQLLDAAADAGRTVVLTSDHGHILRSPSMQVVGAGSGYGERYRIDDADVRADEIEVSGSRVGEGGGRIVVGATNRIRYTPAAKHGYHGGATPAEMLAPLYVLTPPGVGLDGWVPESLVAPDWWDPDAAPIELNEPVTVARPVTRRRPAPDTQLSLIDDEPAPSGTWVEAILSSSQLQTQRARAGRATLSDDELGQVLRLLVAGRGTVSSAASSRSLDLPESRVRGKLSAARSLLNVESYRVLAIEPDGTAVLNTQLLAQQFGLDADPMGERA